METIVHNTEFCVIGGGIAGMFAAISAARHGRKVVLMHERPMLGGNASSEVRMWICGAGGHNNRETGLLEELQLESYHSNPYKLYAVWDGILYRMVTREENITLLLNCSCCDAEMDGDRIVSVKGWQLTTQTWHTVNAKYFADCSGDSVLAPLTGAEYRFGRESKYEFGENVSEEIADRKTMGMSCLIQARKVDRPVKFEAPSWATVITDDIALRRNPRDPENQNYWWLELGGDRDSIGDTETVRDELVALAYGVWNYYKNSGKYPEAPYWQLDWLEFLPGKRESRRMMGDYLMTSADILSGKRFDDVVAFGGWPLDDHEPRGYWYPGHPNTNGRTPAPYDIPYRTLYSRNIANLFFAGRNISMTHAAMSSSRVMATCALLGQAVGTAEYLAGKYDTTPRGVYTDHIAELQETLMDDDSFLPLHSRTVSEACKAAALSIDGNGNAEVLRNGIDRNHVLYGDEEQRVFLNLGGEGAVYTFGSPAAVSRVRVTFDSDLDRDTLPGNHLERTHTTRATVMPESPVMKLPTTLVKAYRILGTDENGRETELFCDTENHRRLVQIPLNGVKLTALRLIIDETWGGTSGNVFSFDFQ